MSRLVLSFLFIVSAFCNPCGEVDRVQSRIHEFPISYSHVTGVSSDEQLVSPVKGPESPITRLSSTQIGSVPLYVETGLASWYGPLYHSRRGANGKIFNMNMPTAAHRTLPLGSLVRVVNLRTNSAIVVRVTDRGPFVQGRILDLSFAAARRVGIWQPGTGKVRVEVLQTPAPIDRGGRWAVQIGAFADKLTASKVRGRIERNYTTTGIDQFLSPTGLWWLCVHVPDDDRKRAQELTGLSSSLQKAFIVRLD